jgi:peptidoglycan hydrolase-like protein with peptidoglycan-binding domain
MSILKKGMTGAPVKRMQEKLGIGADGVFGPGTEKAVKAFQTGAGLKADGIAGPDTFMAMGLEELVLLRTGTRGETVKTLQTALGLDADGRFGPATAAAVMAFQKANGLAADGMAGPATLAKMTAFAGITEETVAKAEVRPDEMAFEPEPMPEIAGVEIIVPKPSVLPGAPVVEPAAAKPAEAAAAKPAVAAASVAAAPAEKSVWGRVKGWFS